MIKLMKSKKFLFGGFLLVFLFFFKTPSLAQVCPAKPSGLYFDYSALTNWGITWNNIRQNVSGYVSKTFGAVPSTGLCYSNWSAWPHDIFDSWSMYTKQMFCNCNNVGFKAYNQKSGCPDVESDEIKVNFGSCICARADFNYDNRINATDETTFNSLYASCLNCTPWTCNWLTCGKADLTRDGVVDWRDVPLMEDCSGSTLCWCGTRPPNDTPAYVCEGRYFGQPQCKAGAVPRSQGACVLDPKWGKIDPRNPSSSTNYWKWTYCYPKGQTSVFTTPTPTTPSQKVCEGTYFGQSQCKARVTPKPGYSCQLNPALGTVNLSQLSNPINYWKWSYCNN